MSNKKQEKVKEMQSACVDIVDKAAKIYLLGMEIYKAAEKIFKIAGALWLPCAI